MSEETTEPGDETASTPATEGVDEYGLAVQSFHSTVLVIVPADGFDETCLRYARSALINVHVGTRSVSTSDEGLIQGLLQDEFQPDAILDGSVTMEPYSGLLLCDGRGVRSLIENPDVLRLIREATEESKLVGTWGAAVEALAKAGVLRKRRVTGAPGVAAAVRAAGGRFTGTQVQRDDRLVTAADAAAGLRFGMALVQVVAIGSPHTPRTS